MSLDPLLHLGLDGQHEIVLGKGGYYVEVVVADQLCWPVFGREELFVHVEGRLGSFFLLLLG